MSLIDTALCRLAQMRHLSPDLAAVIAERLRAARDHVCDDPAACAVCPVECRRWERRPAASGGVGPGGAPSAG